MVLTRPGDTFADSKRIHKGSVAPFSTLELDHHVGLTLLDEPGEMYPEPLPDVFGYVKLLVWHTNPYNRFLPDEVHDIQCQIEFKGEMKKMFGIFNFFMFKRM
jgi:hypothetical protein